MKEKGFRVETWCF